jgi:LmbE family N-acetylglucosaminyl deacetylase
LTAALTSIACLFLSAPAGALPLTGCSASDMYVVAHEDDSLLFQSPALPQDIRNGHCVRSVFLTAGDAGEGESYWTTREAGVKAAYAQLAGAADNWSASTEVVNGHSLRLETLIAQPRVSVLFMRLPDGNPGGEGTLMFGNQSLKRLWLYGNPGAGLGTPLSTLTAVDNSATYGYQDLIDTLSALMSSFEPQVVATQNTQGWFGDGDHADHTAASFFTRAAQASYPASHQLIGYEDYETLSRPENVSGPLLEAKQKAFYLYGEHDLRACAEPGVCDESPYGGWLRRQYVAAIETTGAVAIVGPKQSVASEGTVTLDGSASTASGAPLSYQWTQTAGPAVTLSNPAAGNPTFTAPTGPVTVAFSLVVSDGVHTSAPASVEVKVSAPISNVAPLATATASTEVPGQEAKKAIDGVVGGYPKNATTEWASDNQKAGATLTLKWPKPYNLDHVVIYDRPNPDDQVTAGKLTFSDGQSISFGSLGNTGTPGLTVSFPTHQTTSLIVTVTGVSATTRNVGLAEVEAFGVEVEGGAPSDTPPAILSAESTNFTSGAAAAFTVKAGGQPTPRLSEAGPLPGGLTFHDNGDGTATLSGTAAAVGSPGSSQVYPLTLTADNASGTATQKFTLTVVNGETPPPPPPESSNVAPLATATASTEVPGQEAKKAIDGVVGGYPKNATTEWASDNQKAGATLTLKWPKPYNLDHVVIYDRPNPDDQVTAGKLTFSDGQSISFGSLGNTGTPGLTVSFPTHQTTSLIVTVTGVSATTRNVGLAEVEAFGT